MVNATGTMPAVVWNGTDRLDVLDVPVPNVPQGWALVEVAYTGICGTDLAIVQGKHPRAAHGLIPGHEISGRVVQAGDGGPPAGATVVVEPLISCGTCEACRAGSTHVCRDLELYGIDAPGSLARYVALPPRVLHEVPDGVDARLATLVEPLAVAVHAVDTAAVRPGDTVAVAGAGPIGVLVALVARHAGASRVIVAEPSPARRALAEDLGLTVVPPETTLAEAMLDATDGAGADVTFDAAGHPAVAAQLTAATRIHGTIVIAGVHKEPAAIDLRTVCFKEQRMVGVRVYTTADVRRAIELVAGSSLGLDRLPTRAYPLGRCTEAVRAADAAEHFKILIAAHDEDADA